MIDQIVPAFRSRAVSEGRVERSTLGALPDELAVSVITVGELRAGVLGAVVTQADGVPELEGLDVTRVCDAGAVPGRAEHRHELRLLHLFTTGGCLC
jgi:predicted nucleic acid-binding protein